MIWSDKRGLRRFDLSINATSEEPPPISNRTSASVLCVTKGPQPVTASRASVSRSTISRSRPVCAFTRDRNSSPLSAARHASVAIRRCLLTVRFFSLSAQIFRASIARLIAASERRPVAVSPSPSRTMRENASTTRNCPGRVGAAISNRQLLVPRSSAAYKSPRRCCEGTCVGLGGKHGLPGPRSTSVNCVSATGLSTVGETALPCRSSSLAGDNLGVVVYGFLPLRRRRRLARLPESGTVESGGRPVTVDCSCPVFSGALPFGALPAARPLPSCCRCAPPFTAIAASAGLCTVFPFARTDTEISHAAQAL